MAMRESLFMVKFGKISGTVISCGALNFSGSFASFGASSSSCSRVAREPREIVERPSFGSGEMTSNHAEEYV